MRDIPLADWEPFLEQFARDHRAWLATVESERPGGPPTIEIGERPLVAITVAHDGPRVDALDIRFQPGGQGPDAFHLPAPRSLCVEETADGAALGLLIEDDRGRRTHLRFRGVTPPGLLLDGMAPAEL